LTNFSSCQSQSWSHCLTSSQHTHCCNHEISFCCWPPPLVKESLLDHHHHHPVSTSTKLLPFFILKKGVSHNPVLLLSKLLPEPKTFHTPLAEAYVCLPSTKKKLTHPKLLSTCNTHTPPNEKKSSRNQSAKTFPKDKDTQKFLKNIYQQKAIKGNPWATNNNNSNISSHTLIRIHINNLKEKKKKKKN
jgi:hypothetical protein